MTEMQRHQIAQCGRQCEYALHVADGIERGDVKMPPHLGMKHFRDVAVWWSKRAFELAVMA